MYIVDGIAYAGEKASSLKIVGIRPLDEYKLWIRFNNNEKKIFDCINLLERPCYEPLKDKTLFADVYIDYGAATWRDGEIDISPDYLYENGVSI